jgi:hypothetical protein
MCLATALPFVLYQSSTYRNAAGSECTPPPTDPDPLATDRAKYFLAKGDAVELVLHRPVEASAGDIGLLRRFRPPFALIDVGYRKIELIPMMLALAVIFGRSCGPSECATTLRNDE